MERAKKIKVFLFWFFRLVLVITGALALLQGQGEHLLFVVLIFFLTFLPDLMEKKLRIIYPAELEILMLILIVGGMYFGEMYAYYYKFPWWDKVLHFMSAVIMGSIGFSLIFVLNRSEKVALRLSSKFVAFFAFCFSITILTLWEVFEFGMDQIFGLNMQKDGLMDTMWDLITNAIGAFICSVVGYLQIRHEITVFDYIEKKFFRMNPEFNEEEISDDNK